MKIFDFTPAAATVVNKSDIQIQTSLAKLAFTISAPDPAAGVKPDFKKIDVRLKHVSSRGTVVLIERTPLVTLLEICAAREGFFIKNSNNIRGTVDLTYNAMSFDLQGGYLSLDIDTKDVPVTYVQVHTIDTPATTTSFLYYNPIYINGGITKEIDLVGVQEIAVDFQTIESLQLNFPDRAITYLQEELAFIACDMNDLVHVSGLGGSQTASFGFDYMINLPVPKVNKMTITPLGVAGFYAYLLEEKTL